MSDTQYKLHQSPTINDCLYRHMYRFERIAVMDFDEVKIWAKSFKRRPEMLAFFICLLY